MVEVNTQFKHSKVKGIDFSNTVSMTQQQFKDECDINNIVDHNLRYKDPAFITRMQLQGKVSMAQPIYGDFSEVGDYMHSLEVIKNAQEQFNCLSAKVRDRFDNDPVKMLEFVSDSNNYDEGVRLGLYQPKQLNTDDVIKNVENAGLETVSTSDGETSAQSLT